MAQRGRLRALGVVLVVAGGSAVTVSAAYIGVALLVSLLAEDWLPARAWLEVAGVFGAGTFVLLLAERCLGRDSNWRRLWQNIAATVLVVAGGSLVLAALALLLAFEESGRARLYLLGGFLVGNVAIVAAARLFSRASR